MPADEVLFEFLGSLPLMLIRIILILLLFMHVLFSAVIVKQTKIMTKIVEAKISPTITFVTLVHLFASIGVLVWTLLVFFVLPV